jgi:hypothetical protein
MMVFFDKTGAAAGSQQTKVDDPDFNKAFNRLKRLHRKGELPGLGKASADHHVLVQNMGGAKELGFMTASTTSSDGAAILNFFDNTGKWTGRKEYAPRSRQFFQIVEEVKGLMQKGTIPNAIVHIDVPEHPNNVPRLIVPGNIKSAEEEASLRMSNFAGMAARGAIKRGS